MGDTIDRGNDAKTATKLKTYEEKIEDVNIALKDIGMGRYQWALFVLTGFGYFADNLWPIVTGLILPPVLNEFQGSQGPFLKLGQNIGLLIGAVFWGAGSDIWGRRLSFNVTMLIIGVFAVSAGASPNFTVLTTMVTLWSLGVGGNLPVDTAIFLEFTPSTHQYLLTVLSIWWAFGQLIGSLVAWPLIGNYSCPSPPSSSPNSPYVCIESANRGWRYFLYAMGGLMLLFWVLRFVVFKLYETPKFLVGKGREREAREVLKNVRRYNEGKSARGAGDITSGEDCDEEKNGKIEAGSGELGVDEEHGEKSQRKGEGNLKPTSWWSGLRDEMNVNHVGPLFETRQKMIVTSLLISIWALIGLAFPLYNSFVTYYLATRGAEFGDGSVYITYRNQAILSTIGVPAALLAGYTVSLPYLGRRGTLSIFTLLTGIFILLSTTSRTSNALLGWNCAYTFTSNVMYGVLYAMTPELFDTKDRGTANALCAGANRVFGIMAPIIALYADLTTSVPIFIAGAIFVGAGVLPLLIPIESRDYEAR
ncbi:MFS general substrate transporter [Panaeolus papilionaceus]|nr:MFS general substrate transporter [Panaeolus papilionaceus]